MNFTRLAAGAAIMTALSVNLAMAKPVTVVADVNLRKAAGTDSEIVTLIPKGTSVEVGACTNGWCAVTWNGMDGFSIATNLGLAPRPPARPVGAVGQAYPPGVYPPPPAYVEGPPVVYYGPGPYYGPCCYYGYGGRGYWRGGWGYHRHW